MSAAVLRGVVDLWVDFGGGRRLCAVSSSVAVRSVARTFVRFAEAGSTSALQARMAVALAGSGQAQRVLETVPARHRRPALILAVLHDLALAGCCPPLTVALAAGDFDAIADAAVEAVVVQADWVVATARRSLRTVDAGSCPVLYPAVAEAAHRVDAAAVALIDVGCAAGINLQVDRVGITYSTGQFLGDPTSPVQLTAALRGHRPAVPMRAMPPVAARIGIDPDPIEVTDPDEARWLRACTPPDRTKQVAELNATLTLLTSAPARLLTGDPIEVLPAAIADVPAEAVPVVTTTWALARHSRDDRVRFLQQLDRASTHRPVAWVSVEGVGVAPAMPTFGDRHASGHSIIGVTVFEHGRLYAEAVGRCWSRGRLMSWLADP